MSTDAASTWRDDSRYEYTARLSRREWAWEFLRRNHAFCEAGRSCQLEYGIVGYDAGTTMLVSQFETPRLTEWGLLYSSAPDQDALTAIVFWSPDLCLSVLRMTAFPLSTRIDATPLLLRDIACASVLLDVPDVAGFPLHLAWHDPRSKDIALQHVAGILVNFIIGNADAHGKNFSLLYGHDGTTLAPLYDDLMCTVA